MGVVGVQKPIRGGLGWWFAAAAAGSNSSSRQQQQQAAGSNSSTNRQQAARSRQDYDGEGTVRKVSISFTKDDDAVPEVPVSRMMMMMRFPRRYPFHG